MTDFTPPPEFDGYRVSRLLGRGGMGQVFLAQDTLLDRLVAIKLISAADAGEAARKRFFVEARAVARLSHPNVVSIYRAGEIQGRPYLVSEYVPGVGLDRLPLPVPWTRALALGLGVARGLSTAHRRGVVHRDIKPANILVTEDGEPKILDFGIAKLLDPQGGGARRGPELPEPVLRPDEESGREDEVTRPVSLRVLEHREEPAEPAQVSGPGITRSRHAMGTPLYMAPEVWRGEEATYASDVYAMGALLFTLCVGHPPHQGATIAELGNSVVTTDARPLGELVPGVDPRFSAIVDRCLSRDPTRRFRSAGDLRAALSQLTPEARPGVVPEGNPYRGLHAFEATHSPLFFGRDSETRGILERLRAEPCVAVTGDSGVGKSSICRAAVLPRISAWLGDERAWASTTLVPGAHPVAALAAALAPHLGVAESALAERMTEDPSSAARELRGLLGRDRGLVVFIDQLEELSTLSDRREATTAAEVLGWLTAPSASLRLLATVRGDFLGRLAALPAVGDVVARSLYVLRPLTAERIRDAIVGPAQALGVRFESEAMIDALVTSTVDAEGGLPLLQFALAELWDARDQAESSIPAAALAALGGVEGALQRHADDVLARMVPDEARAARRMVQRLVTAAGTRARRSEDELTSGDGRARAALDALVRGRLVVARETAEGSGYEIAHEALLGTRGLLARWISSGAEAKAVRERLAAAVSEWRRLGRAREALWSARQLDELGVLDPEDHTRDEAAFVAASRRALGRARAARAAAVLAVPLALGLAYGGVALEARRAQAHRVGEHLTREAVALGEARVERALAAAYRREAHALFDGPDQEAAERVWADVRAREALVPSAYGRASQELEAALLTAPARADLRARFADLLAERVLAAEEQRDAQRDELLRRLAVYDDGGERTRGLAAPAELTVRTDPVDARVSLARYVERERGRLALDEELDLGPGPLAAHRTPPGSYLLTFRAPGRIAVRLPIVLGRGAREEVALDLPLPGEVPEGFAYIPPGRFLFGTTADDVFRRTFLNSVPAHEVQTGAYLVALHETTFGEWLEYVRSFAPAERAPHLPRVGEGGFKGALTVGEGPGDAFELSITPAGREYRAALGAPVVYPERAQRASQDWRRFPVAGVDVAEARAYAAWLDRSGRVPGARLCTEREWERAARGADGRAYPHGERLDRPDDANFDETYRKLPAGMGPDEVGSHPGTQSPFGLDDVVGNVWEWTASSLVPGEHVARGGGFRFNGSSNRSDNREVTEPSLRDVSMGLRICADAARRPGAQAEPAR